MRRLPFSFSALGFAGLTALAMSASVISASAALADSPLRTITVTGDASIARAPDMATVTIGVTSTAETAAEALAANSKSMEAVIARLKESGVAAADLQTSGLSVSPNYNNNYSSDTGAPQGFVAMNMVTVGIRDLTKLGGVVDAVVADGANTLNGISFGLIDPRPALDEARKAAVADARARAEVLAGAAGVSIGDLVSISEGYGYSGGPAPLFKAEAASVPVETGEVSYQATATVTWEIEKP